MFCVSMCVFCGRWENRQLCVGLGGAVSFVILTQAWNVYELCFAFTTVGLPLSQHFNYLVNILATNIDYLANPITESAIDPSTSSPTIST